MLTEITESNDFCTLYNNHPLPPPQTQRPPQPSSSCTIIDQFGIDVDEGIPLQYKPPQQNQTTKKNKQLMASLQTTTTVAATSPSHSHSPSHCHSHFHKNDNESVIECCQRKETITQGSHDHLPDLAATFPSNPVILVDDNNNQDQKKESTMISNESPTTESISASGILMSQKTSLFESILSKKSVSLSDFGDSYKSNLSLDLDSENSDYTISDYFFVRNVNTVNVDDLVQSKFGKCQMLDSDLIFNENLKKIRNRFKPIFEALQENDALYNGNQHDNFITYSLGNVEFEQIISTFSSSTQEYCEYELKFIHDFFKIENQPIISQSLPLIISLKSLTIDELKCTVNVLKKIQTLSSYTHAEKILISQSLTLPDLYSYLFFDNPTRNLSETNKALIRKRSDSNGSDSSSESSSRSSSSPSLLSKFFKRKESVKSLSPFIPVGKDLMYLQVYLVIFEFSESDIIEIPHGYEHNVYRTAIGIGNWILEWKENSIIIPSRKTPFKLNPGYHCIPLRKVDGDSNIEKLLCKLSNICCIWNGNYVYDLKCCNHQHFVRDVIEMIDQECISTKLYLFADQQQPTNSEQSSPTAAAGKQPSTPLNDNISVGGQSSTSSTPYSIKLGSCPSEFGFSVDRFLQYIQRNGYAPLTFYINDHVKEVLFGKKSTQMKKSRSSPNNSPHHNRPVSTNSSTSSLESSVGSSPSNRRPQDFTSSFNGYFNRNEELDEYNEKEYITFKEHRELDSLYYQIKNAFSTTSKQEYFKTHPEGKWDFWLLKLLDRGFWTRITHSHEKINRDQKDYPLTKLNARVTLHKESLEKLMEQKHVNIVIKTNIMFHEKEENNCPFNLDVLSTLEMDMSAKLSDTTFLGDYEPPVPHKRSWIITSKSNVIM